MYLFSIYVPYSLFHFLFMFTFSYNPALSPPENISRVSYFLKNYIILDTVDTNRDSHCL